MASPDPIVVERQMYLNLLGITDDPKLTMADLKLMTAGGARVETAVNQILNKQLNDLIATKVDSTLPTISSVQNIETADAIALRRFRTALANRATARCDMLHIGDSTTWGYHNATDGISSYNQAWVCRLRDIMRSKFPTPNVSGGFGYLSTKQDFPPITRSDSFISFVGGAASSGNGGLDKFSRTLSAAGDTVTVTFTGTGIDIQYLKFPSGGTFSWAVDGGSATNVNTNDTGTSSNNIIQVRGLASGSHTLVVARVAFSTQVGGFFIYSEDESSGIGSWMVAYPGTTSAYWNQTTPVGKIWSDALTWATPDLVTIALGINDYKQPTYISAADYKTNLLGIINTIKTNLGYSPSFVLVAMWETVKSGSNPDSWEAYRAVMYDIAANDPVNVCVFDAGKRVKNGLSDTGANGLLSPLEGTHLTPAGEFYMAETFAGFLAP